MLYKNKYWKERFIILKNIFISLICILPLSTNDNTLPVNASVSLNNTEIAECYIPTLN